MVWQLLDTATGRVEQEGRIDGVAATLYRYWPCRTGGPYWRYGSYLIRLLAV